MRETFNLWLEYWNMIFLLSTLLLQTEIQIGPFILKLSLKYLYTIEPRVTKST